MAVTRVLEIRWLLV